MYLHEIFLQNTGPISECHVKPLFDVNENPQPIVVVGPNGSGKTIFLSYIVDALIEFGKEVFRDIAPFESSGASPYFRAILPKAIRSGRQFSLSFLHFKSGDENLLYCEKSGVLDSTVYTHSSKPVFAPIWNWETNGNYKEVFANEKTVLLEMQSGAHVFFPACRREDPYWLNPRSLKTRLDGSSTRRYGNHLDKPIWAETCGEENVSWVLDVFLDSLTDPEDTHKLNEYLKFYHEENKTQKIPVPQELLPVVSKHIIAHAKNNVEAILREILQDQDAKLKLNYRNIESSRISIQMSDGRRIPTLQSLSDGESQLFNLFATIIRYGERTDLHRSVNLSQITGIVIIDEIAAHLHPTLQHDVLPELIGLFPKVQFIVSSHSPLFLLGMEKRFGIDKVAILEMPEAKRINSERYSEFGKAFEYIQSTVRFEEEIKQRFAAGTKPLILTEGALDPRYIKPALTQLGQEKLLNSFDIEFVGLENEKGTHYGGDKGLNHFRNIYAANPSLFYRPILLLYDCDTQKPDEQIGELWVRSIPKNAENTKVEVGIENLFPADLFQDCFYPEVPRKDGGSAKYLDKPQFCDWVCENRSVVNFAKFDSVVNILKEFVETHQSTEVQQPSPE